MTHVTIEIDFDEDDAELTPTEVGMALTLIAAGFRGANRVKAYVDGELMAERNQPGNEGDPCPQCNEPLCWDKQEQMVYCINDWEHG